MFRASRCIFACLLAALAISSSGCGSPEYPVNGKVTYNGAVLNKGEGILIFLGPNGEQVDTVINSDGTYSVSKVRAGKNKIAVYYRNPEFKTKKPSGRTAPKADDPPPPPPYLTPQNYALPDQSGIEIDVNKATTFDIDMKGPPIR